ncbi:prolyl oligopeptidase family serine peptidase [Flavobacterium sp. GT3R68]|uniref:prolyl oligopeptidase family serine peptidase n=1 Tax=Flavobacterium sp. GT3R68 TaxID=2594437 RepID=UPI000F89907A|nr:prolyl oligopeptidase family serine peptidase [Flavobacterium sp. GT3R68]RTY95315.1 S9 family peptidase [Flavobacterium sp. GSN2]TRW90945.1 prolyl oligopeptidase family serine peptidase [Flavobacterium sp. GT3R68]
MKTRFTLPFAFLIFGIFSLQGQIKPQLTPVKMVTDEYYGIKVNDPYRYLENLEDPLVLDWMKSNANYARATLDAIPERQALLNKLLELDKREGAIIYNLRILENDHYFYLKVNPEDETGKLYHRQGYKGEEKLLFNPEEYKKSSGIHYTISSISPNDKGDLAAFEIAANGSESSDLIIIDINGKIYPEIIDRCWFSSASWLPDGKSFLYNRLSSADVKNMNRELNSKTYIHKVGDDPKNDIDFFSNTTNPELKILPEEFPMVYFHKNSNTLFGMVITVDKRYKVYVAPYPNNQGPTTWKSLIQQSDEVTDFKFSKENIYYSTFKNAPNYKIIKVPFSDSNIKNAKTVIKEPKKGHITNFAVTKDGLYYSITENGVQAKVFFLENEKTTPVELKLPFAAGSAFFETKDERFSDIWITVTGWTSPTKRYLYSPETNSFEYQPLSKAIEYPEFNNLVVKEVMVPSHDGVMVPVSIISNKRTEMKSNNPVLMFGYGAYGASMDPYFSSSLLTYCTYGGILVIPHVRGGGEMGDAWHKAGQKTTKPNTWKDLIASAEYLIANKYTSPKKIAIASGSAGGILIGRAITERPDLFAAAVPLVGCLNPVRMENSPNGPVNTPEFGTVKNEEEFQGLLAMDSYLHVKDGVNYPATLITAGMNDPRVIAWEPAKFAARLQAANGSDKPILFYTDFEAGHGMGNSKTKSIESLGDLVSFSLWQTGQEKFQPAKKLKN